jgi:dolichol kinase
VNPATPDTSISYRTELIRKGIHLCSIVIPLLYFTIPRNVALAIIIPLTLGFIAVDIARHRNAPFEKWFHGMFGWLLREHESDRDKKQLNGATYVLIAATICLLIFPKVIAVTSFIVLIIADMMGALIGRKFGRHRFLGKSIEGSSAFFLSALIVIFVTPKIGYAFGEYLIGAFAAVVGTVFEALPWNVDDNISIPLSVGITLWIGYLLFLPGLDIYKFG